MSELNLSQRSQLIDLTEQVIDHTPIDHELLRDHQVVHQFLVLSKDYPNIRMTFLRLVSVNQWSQLTEADVLTEEMMLELHLSHGFNSVDLTHWLRLLSFDGVQFFESIANQRPFFQLEHLLFKSRYDAHVINGVYIDELPKYFDSFEKLVDHALNTRISFKQYCQIFLDLSLSKADATVAIEALIQDHGVLAKIERSNQLLPFRLFCVLLDYLDTKGPYNQRFYEVMDQLLLSSTVQKTMAFVNSQPSGIILELLGHYIRTSNQRVLDHLNNELIAFTYGRIRKIVRRNQLGLNYRYE